MMGKLLSGKNILFSIVIISSIALSFQSCKKEAELPTRYKYSEKPKLEIADFRGAPDIWGDWAAETYSGYNLDYEEKN